jgi:transposase
MWPRAIVDLLPNRTAGSLVTWLGAHDAPTFICRACGGEYASGARQAAPDAVQIADRFHLQGNRGRRPWPGGAPAGFAGLALATV